MTALPFLRLVPLAFVAALCSCGIQPHRIAAGTTVATSEQVPVVIQTILEYEESGGGVPFFARFTHLEERKRAATSLLSSVQIVVPDDGSHAEIWVVDVNGQLKPFTVTFYHGPGGNPFGPDGCWVRHVDLVQAETPSAAEYEIESARRFSQPMVREQFSAYAVKDFSFSKQFGIVMPKAFAYSRDGAWGVGVSGLQDWARQFALQKCEAMRKPNSAKCMIVNIDGKWTR